MMKKYGYSAAVFAVCFVLFYLAVSFLIPGWRLKLAADPAEVFFASLRHMAPIKGAISAALSAFATVLFSRRK